MDDDIKTETGARGQNLSGDENDLSEDDHENIDVVTECNFEEYSELSSLDGSIPSSLATAAPPSIFSYSSYEESPIVDDLQQSPDLGSINFRKAQNCQVSLRKMSLYSWWGPNLKPEHNSENRNNKLEKHVTNNLRESALLVPDFNDKTSDSDSDDDVTNIDILDVCETDLMDVENEADDILEENYANYALELNELKNLVDNSSTSVLDLYLNIMKILDNTAIDDVRGHEIREEMRNYHRQVFQETFPWFDLDDPAKHWAQWEPGLSKPPTRGRSYRVRPPTSEHSYSKTARKRRLSELYCQQSQPLLSPVLMEGEEQEERKCCLCGVKGDQDISSSSRLLPLRFNEWIHLNCAIWSSEVIMLYLVS